MKKSATSGRFALGALILSVLLLARFLFQKGVLLENKEQKQKLAFNQNLQRSLDKFWPNSGFPEIYKLFWLQVSKMETANFTSHLWTFNKNPWGMKRSYRRKNSQNTKYYEMVPNGEWAYYKTLDDAAHDIILWMQARDFSKTITNISDFVEAMYKQNYFVGESAQTYLQKVLNSNRT